MTNLLLLTIKKKCALVMVLLGMMVWTLPCAANVQAEIESVVESNTIDSTRSNTQKPIINTATTNNNTALASHSSDGDGDSNSAVTPNVINNSANMIEVFFVLLAIVAFILLIAWFMKRIGYTGMPKNQVMNIKACLSLSSKERLILVDIAGEQVVIGVAPGFVGHVKSLSTPIDFNQSHSTTSSVGHDFSAVLKKIVHGNKHNKNVVDE